MTQVRHKWANPSDWLNEKVATADERTLRGYLNTIILSLFEDEIQDTFQTEMSEDGYFIPMCSEEGCDNEQISEDTPYCVDHEPDTNTKGATE